MNWLFAENSETNQRESGNQSPSPSSSLPPLQTAYQRGWNRWNFDEMIARDSETNQNESGNQAPSSFSSLLPCVRLIQGDEMNGMKPIEFDDFRG